MGVYINGMEMPKHDDEYVIFTVYGDGGVVYGPLNRPHVRYKNRAVPVHEPHGRLGDLDRLAKEVEDMIKEFPLDSIGAERYRLFAELIKTAPTVIPASEKEKLNDNS